ncbi:hypothetical protein ACFL0Q_02005 [Thermodesulfobacteriota bacterium]
MDLRGFVDSKREYTVGPTVFVNPRLGKKPYTFEVGGTDVTSLRNVIRDCHPVRKFFADKTLACTSENGRVCTSGEFEGELCCPANRNNATVDESNNWKRPECQLRLKLYWSEGGNNYVMELPYMSARNFSNYVKKLADQKLDVTKVTTLITIQECQSWGECVFSAVE